MARWYVVSCALRFFFGVTLGRKDVVDRIVSAREPKRMPIVLSNEQRRGRALSPGGAGFAQPGRANDGL